MKRIVLLVVAVALLWACRPSQPLIGISCGRTSSGAASLGTNYTEAVARAGGIPVIFPTVSDPALAAKLLEKVDGVIFSGGPDLDPSHYGETIWNETVSVDTLRDESDLMLMRAALASKKPVMCICRGEQLMNVVLGGSLYQDLPTQVDTLVRPQEMPMTGARWQEARSATRVNKNRIRFILTKIAQFRGIVLFLTGM